jgi:hypothetical protein
MGEPVSGDQEVTQFLYKLALIYANYYPTASLYECTTKLKKARNIIIPDGASLGWLVLKKGLEFMLEKTELVTMEPQRYVVVLNDSISTIADAIKIPAKVDLEQNYAIMIYTDGDKAEVTMDVLDDERRNRIIDETCYRPSPFS